jgi:hypothetical protein
MSSRSFRMAASSRSSPSNSRLRVSLMWPLSACRNGIHDRPKALESGV